MLSQTHKSLELIIADDCSTDGTEDYVKSLADERVRYFRNEHNSGQELTRMNALRRARGKYITFLDDDDYYTDYEFFEKAIAVFTEHEADEVPIVMVYANARVINLQTNTNRIRDIGKPYRVKGLDFLLHRAKYQKPPSTFTTVFRADILKRAGLENMIIFDTETYCQAALLGDAWMLPDIIGVYKLHKQSTSFGYTDHPAQNKRIDAKIKAMAERGVLISEGIRAISDKKSADKWCTHDSFVLMYCYRGQQKYINEIKTYGRAMLIMSKFTPSVILKAPFWEARRLLSKITPLRKLYRFIKYRLRGRPYPED